MKTVWQRYFLLELLKVFALFILSFYFLYVLIDYSAHTKTFQNTALSFLNVAAYYAFQFAKRADILIPIALMIASIKVLTTSNVRNEIVALAAGGISLKKILRPFLWAATACAVLLYLNFQFLQPYSLDKITAFEDRFFKAGGSENVSKPVNALVLQDHSLLIYQHYDHTKRAFFDLFWLKSTDQIYRIHSLYPYEAIPFGTYVEVLERSEQGELLKTASHEVLSFPEMRFDNSALFNAAHPPRMQSLTQLAKGIRFSNMNDREAEAATFFFFKLTAPLICFLAILGPAPFCMRFSRTLPVFFIYALSLVGMVTFFTLLNTAIILGESQVIHPLCAIFLPQALFVVVLGWNYAKL